VVWTLEENEQELNEGKNGEDHNSFYNYVVTMLWKTFWLAFISIIYRSVFIKKLLSILDMSVFPETEWEIGIDKIFKNIFVKRAPIME